MSQSHNSKIQTTQTGPGAVSQVKELWIKSIWHSQVWKWYSINWRGIRVRFSLLGEQWILFGLLLLRFICTITLSILLLLHRKVLDVRLLQKSIVHLGLVICWQQAFLWAHIKTTATKHTKFLAQWNMRVTASFIRREKAKHHSFLILILNQGEWLASHLAGWWTNNCKKWGDMNSSKSDSMLINTTPLKMVHMKSKPNLIIIKQNRYSVKRTVPLAMISVLWEQCLMSVVSQNVRTLHCSFLWNTSYYEESENMRYTTSEDRAHFLSNSKKKHCQTIQRVNNSTRKKA